jgi:hypothetical protein
VANPTIKSTAIVRAGYEFQDLVGIETLIRFYRAPDLFEWVALEADDDDYGSLDDVVAARSDGTFEFVQVKFTVGGGEYLLDWDWLLSRKGRGTSLLNKWAKSFQRVRGLGPIHSACLRTNRPPSQAFEGAMKGALLSLDLLDDATRQLVETECGGPDAAAEFFGQFEFQTIDETLPGLEARIRLELVPSDTRLEQAVHAAVTLKADIARLDNQIDQLMDRIVEASSVSMITAYERRVEKLQREKLIAAEKLQQKPGPKRPFEEMFELACDFLSSPWNIWNTESLAGRRMVIRMVFSERPAYGRNSGFRTPKTTLPFKLLGDLHMGKCEMAERKGFEPSRQFITICALSRGVPSTTRPPLRQGVDSGRGVGWQAVFG